MKLSIITINYNNAAGLKKTLDSVAAQTYTDFEHIIVDGASTDGSVDEIIAYSQSPIANRHKITWISEPDTGIYNAMNKGVRMAQGEYTLMLNSGDYLVDNSVVEKVIPLLGGTDIIQGNTISIIDEEEVTNKGYGKSNISFTDVYKGHFLHQATLAKKELFDKYGYFDENYKIGGDTVFFMKTLGLGSATFKYVDFNIAYYDLNGISASKDEKWLKQKAKEDIMYDALLSPRLVKLCKEDSCKIDAYNNLSKNVCFKKVISLMLWIYKAFNNK